MVDEDGHSTKKDMEESALLNEYFASVFIKLNPTNFEKDRKEPFQRNKLPTVNTETVGRCLFYLKKAKSGGRLTYLLYCYRGLRES